MVLGGNYIGQYSGGKLFHYAFELSNNLHSNYISALKISRRVTSGLGNSTTFRGIFDTYQIQQGGALGTS